jgi:acetyltransferase
MATYPAHLEKRHVLADGRSVMLRPVRPEDEIAERGFFARLSEEARRLRFMKFVAAVNERLVHSFTHVDYEERMAFVCEHRGEIVGEARYAATPHTASCDFGIVIADAWHRSGIAGLLMQALTDHARSRGYETMEGLVLRDNRTMLRFVRALGFELRPIPGEPTLLQVVKVLRSTSSASARSAQEISTG